MPVQESSIAEVVTEASAKMHDPQYISSEVDRFIGSQPAVSQLVMASSSQLTVEGVVMVLFHAALIAESISRATGTPIQQVTPDSLGQAASTGSTVEDLATDEPHLASYIASNVEDGGTGVLSRNLLVRIVRALVP